MSHIIWNWLLENWPTFTYDKKALQELEFQFYQNTGSVLGVLKHIEEGSKNDLLVEILSNEALKTSEIEGEYLDRDSLQSSIKRNLGLAVDRRKVPPAEYGISEMMVDLYQNYHKPLNHHQLYAWHEMITNGRRDLSDIGRYRTHDDPMQIVSGRLDRPKVHYEAPPSKKIPHEMDQFITWFNAIHGKNKEEMLPLAKAGIAHFYFETIHPFEDGNGRIGRAIAEKSIALSINQPSLLSLSHTITKNKKQYYAMLEKHNQTLEITDWLVYFGQTIIEAQAETIRIIDFLIEKTKFFDRHKSVLNPRQIKVVKRLFEAGPSGFVGGLSANNYTSIAKTSASTATRDLADLVERKILTKTGSLRSTRYSLNFSS